MRRNLPLSWLPFLAILGGSTFLLSQDAEEPPEESKFTNPRGSEIKAHFVRREGTQVILRSESGTEKGFPMSIFSSESKLKLIELAMASKTPTEEQLELQKKLIGIWSATDGSGFEVAFDAKWRIPLKGVNTPEGDFFGDLSGFFTYELDAGAEEGLIRIFMWEKNGDNPISEWKVQSLEGDRMTLLGVNRQMNQPSTSERVDPKTVSAPFNRVDPEPPEPDPID
jgi:hypothetical protein